MDRRGLRHFMPRDIQISSQTFLQTLLRPFLRTFLGLLFYGSQVAHAIVGGTPVSDNDPIASHVVALQMSENQNDGSIRYYKGTAIVVGSRVLLTAGHNLYYLAHASDALAIFDVAPLWGKKSEGDTQVRISVLGAQVHPDFRATPEGTENDLAVVSLSEEIPPGYAPVHWPSRKGAREPSQRDGNFYLAEVAGYGKSSDAPSPPLEDFRLRQAHVASLANPIRPEEPKLWFDQSAGGICAGDSGGPAFRIEGDRAVLIGVAVHIGRNSSGVTSCWAHGAFMNVVYYRNWIEQAIGRLIY